MNCLVNHITKPLPTSSNQYWSHSFVYTCLVYFNCDGNDHAQISSYNQPVLSNEELSYVFKETTGILKGIKLQPDRQSTYKQFDITIQPMLWIARLV